MEQRAKDKIFELLTTQGKLIAKIGVLNDTINNLNCYIFLLGEKNTELEKQLTAEQSTQKL